MAVKSYSIQIDEEVKDKATALYANLGLTLSKAINVFFRVSLDKNGFPFPVQLSERGKAESHKSLAQGNALCNHGENQCQVESLKSLAQGNALRNRSCISSQGEALASLAQGNALCNHAKNRQAPTGRNQSPN